MKKSLLLLIGIFLVSSCNFSPGKTIQKKIGKETVQIKTDGRPWKLVFNHDAGTKGVDQYVLEGETAQEWTEMITVNYFVGLKGPDVVTRLIDFTKKGLDGACKNVIWTPISQSEIRGLYEWAVTECKDTPDQAEIAVALQGKEGFYVLHYATKTVPMPEKQHDTWKKLLENARL